MTNTKTFQISLILIAASLLLMLLVGACSSNGNGGGSNGTPIVTPGGKVTRDTLVSYIRHYGKLNVFKKPLRGEIIINDTSKIKKFLGDCYPLWADEYTDRILKVPYDVYVEIGFDLGEIAFSVQATDENQFTADKPTPIVDITGIYILFDQELRKIGKLRWDITDEEFSSAWSSANVAETIKEQIAKKQKDVFIDVALAQAISELAGSIRGKYPNIDFQFEPVEKTPTFNEIPNPIIDKK